MTPEIQDELPDWAKLLAEPLDPPAPDVGMTLDETIQKLAKESE